MSSVHGIWNIKPKHRTVDKTVLSLETSTCIRRLMPSVWSWNAPRADISPAGFGAHPVWNWALMVFVPKQVVGKCEINGFFCGGGRKCRRGLEGEGAVGQGMLKLSNASLVFLRKTLPFSLQHFSDARPSPWKHSMPAKRLKFPMSVVWSRPVLAAPVSGSQTFSMGRN